jgi:hypothetical protein
MGAIANPSAVTSPNASGEDQLNATEECGNGGPLVDSNGNAIHGRCGHGPRLFVISPWARDNFADHTVTRRTSTIRLIEDNGNLDRLDNGSCDQRRAESITCSISTAITASGRVRRVSARCFSGHRRGSRPFIKEIGWWRFVCRHTRVVVTTIRGGRVSPPTPPYG